MGLALLAHGLLLAALTWGVGWKRDTPVPVFEAELWSRLPEQAAARAEAPPPAEAVVEPETRPAPPPPGPKQADIATQREQQKKADAQRALQEAREKARAEKAAAEKKAADKAAADKKAAERKAAEDKSVRERAEAQAERLRQENIRRLLGQAGASGGPQASGTAPKSSGPSPSYGGKVAARIKPNVVFTDPLSGNPRAEVEVRALPDGTIVGRRLVKSSGNEAWDEAVLKAIDRTGSLPRDTDGRVPSPLIIGLRPQD